MWVVLIFLCIVACNWEEAGEELHELVAVILASVGERSAHRQGRMGSMLPFNGVQCLLPMRNPNPAIQERRRWNQEKICTDVM